MLKKRNIWWFLILLVAIASVILAVKFFIQKEKDSKALAEHVPASPYKAEVDVKQALSILYSLKGDTQLHLENTKKWKRVFGGIKNAGIDFLVNPWVFGNSRSVNIGFQLSSIPDFQKWASLAADTVFSYNEEEFYRFSEANLTFCHSGNSKALACTGNLEIAQYWSAKFFHSADRQMSTMSNSQGLLEIQVDTSLSLFNLFEIPASIYSVHMDAQSLTVNPPVQEESDIPLSLSFLLDSAKWNSIKRSKQAKEVMELLGLSKIKIDQTKPMFGIVLKDTFHQITKSVTYDFDDDFNKVRLEKISRKPLPDLSITFRFSAENQLNEFYKLNKLSKFNHPFLRVFKIGNNIVLSPKSTVQEKLPPAHLIYNADAFWKLTTYLGLKKSKKEGPLKDVETVFYNKGDNQTNLRMRFSVHPLKWFLKMSEELKPLNPQEI